MRGSGQAVVQVPQHIRQNDQDEGRGQAQPVARAKAQRGNHQRAKHRTQQKVSASIFRQNSQPGHCPCQQRKAQRGRFDKPGVKVECGRKEGRHDGIGRGKQAAQRGHRQRDIAGRNPDRHARAAKPGRRCRQDHRRGPMEHRPRCADPEGRVAARHRRDRTNHPGDQGRLGIIAEGKALPPQPVLAFIHKQVGAVEDQQAKPQSRDGGNDGKGWGKPAAGVRPGHAGDGSAKDCGNRSPRPTPDPG